ncbi:MAG: hypothetical protein IPK16_06855 [Anaerolineales bacterium]|nr:hypothetical protein [Anaerolineales bacterium]
MNQALMLPVLPELFALFISAAVVSFLLQRWARWTALGGAVLAALLALGLWQIDFSRPLLVLGGGFSIDFGAPVEIYDFTLQLDQSNVAVVVISLLIGAGALLLAARRHQSRLFPGLAWLLLTGYTLLALMTSGVRSPLFAAPLFLTMLAAVGIFALQNGKVTDPSGPLRTLLPPLLAAPLFIIAVWYIDQIPLNPQDVTLTVTAGTLLGVGLLLLLAPFPLHGATPAAAETAPPVAMLLVILLHQVAVLHLSAQVLNTYPFVALNTDWTLWLSWLGLLTAVWGGAATVGARNAGRLWGYVSLLDWGLIIVVLAVPSLRSWTLVLFLMCLRVISMFTAAAGLVTIEAAVGSLEMEKMRGIGMRMPWNSAAYLLGGLGLVGFPLTAGFAGHWAALLTLAEVDWRPAAVVLVASGLAVVAFVRVARLMFGHISNRTIPRERATSAALAIAALAITIGVAVAPQVLSTVIGKALSAFG